MQAVTSDSAASATAQAGEYLTFRLGEEEYGIDILRVQEIRSYEAPTRIANAPPFIKGVVNLRGVIVPIIDLRLKLGCSSAEYNAFTVVIVLNLRGRVVGVIVDSVSDVLQLDRDHIKPAPEMTTVKALYSADEQPSLRRRSMIGTITPRRLTTPLMKGGALAMRVGAS